MTYHIEYRIRIRLDVIHPWFKSTVLFFITPIKELNLQCKMSYSFEEILFFFETNVQRIELSYHLKIFEQAKSLLISKRNLPKVISRNGYHFTNCVWAVDTNEDGPDTCLCDFAEIAKRDLTRLIDWYKMNVKDIQS